MCFIQQFYLLLQGLKLEFLFLLLIFVYVFESDLMASKITQLLISIYNYLVRIAGNSSGKKGIFPK